MKFCIRKYVLDIFKYNMSELINKTGYVSVIQ
jgi:hypothetical protein